MVMEVVLIENTLEQIRKMPYTIEPIWLFAATFCEHFVSDSPLHIIQIQMNHK